jgi:hypothetical protein
MDMISDNYNSRGGKIKKRSLLLNGPERANDYSPGCQSGVLMKMGLTPKEWQNKL